MAESSWWNDLFGKSAGTQFTAYGTGQTFDNSVDAYNATDAAVKANPSLGASLAGKGYFGEVKTEGTGLMGALGSDTMKGVGTVGGLAMSGLGIWNQMNAQDQAKKQWEAENDRANQVMAMNTERYNQWKADRDSLKAQYSGKKV